MQPGTTDPIDTMEELEAFRLNALAKNKRLMRIIPLFVLIIILCMVGFCLLIQWADPVGVCMFVFFFGAIAVGVLFYFKNKNTKEYRRVFRSVIVNKMWQNVDPQVNFEPARFIPKDWFLGSKIHRVTPNTYKGENHIYKQYPNFNLYASELDVTRRGSGKNNSNVPVFNGLFFVFELHNRHFSGTTLIMKDNSQNPLGLGFLTDLVEKITYHKYNNMQFNNTEFEKYFQIFSTIPDETKDVIQNDVVIQLLATRMEKPVQMSFVGKYVCIAIDDRGTFFQADPKISLTDENSLRKYLNELDKYQSYYSRFVPIVERIAG